MDAGTLGFVNDWHVAALSQDVIDKPVAATLLGVDVVLWRTPSGVVAFEDRCPHRGTRLSLGWIKNDALVCPYHGWRFAADGALTQVPAIPRERGIPGNAQARSVRCVERYALVFVCLGKPERPIYDIPEMDDPAYRAHLIGPVPWKTSAARSVENFMDEAHLPWVHPGMLGNPERVPEVRARDIRAGVEDFYYETQSEVGNRLDPSKSTLNRLTYHVVVPFTVYHENIYPNGDRVIDLFFCTPVDESNCIRYMLVLRNFALEQPSDKLIAFTLKIWEQDRPLVESQQPKALPLDWETEIHLRGPDSPSIAYRRMLRQALHPNGTQTAVEE